MINNYRTKILLITSRADYGGGPEHLFRLLSGLNNAFDFFVACPFEAPYFDRYKNIVTEKKIIRIPHRKFTFTDLNKLKSFILKNDIRIVHSHGKGAGIYSRLLGVLTNIKCVHTFHGVHIDQYNALSKIIYNTAERFMKKKTDAFISVSQSEYTTILNNKFADKNKLHIIENGVVIPNLPVNSNVFNAQPLLIASITRFDYAKNSSLIINILERLAEKKSLSRFKFLLIGSGPEETAIKAKLKQINFSEFVEFTGNLPEPSEILRKSFCYLSTSRWEGLPLGILEAMAYGIPVVASNVIGNKDLVVNGVNGFLFNLSEPQLAANYLMKLAGDLTLWNRFSIEARKMVLEKYSLIKMTDKIKSLYERIDRR